MISDTEEKDNFEINISNLVEVISANVCIDYTVESLSGLILLKEKLVPILISQHGHAPLCNNNRRYLSSMYV